MLATKEQDEKLARIVKIMKDKTTTPWTKEDLLRRLGEDLQRARLPEKKESET